MRESVPLVRTHHLHVVRLVDPQLKAYLDLRDFLRANSRAREAYLAEKLALAERYAESRREYTEAKDAIIRRLLSEAGPPTQHCC